MIKNIVFDFGGVLMDWDPRYLYKDIFDHKEEMEFFLENIVSPEWNIQQDAGRGLAEATWSLQEKHPDYSREIALFYGEWPKMLRGTLPDNVALLHDLHGKYPLYGLTNWSAESFPYAYERYDFFQLFDGIVVSGIEKVVKPQPEIYQILLNRYQLKAEECLFIDDNLRNTQAAAQLGFHVIHFNGTRDLREEVMQLLSRNE